MATPQPASPPFRSEDRNRTVCYIDTGSGLKEASWPYERGGPAFPDFGDHNPELDITIKDLQLSESFQTLWKESTPLGYGSDACIRLTDHVSHPVIKLAHPKAECRQRLRREFEVMRCLTHLPVVAQIYPEPLTDEDGIFGFRTERLHRLEKEDTSARKEDIKAMLDKVHQAGYCHGDVHFCNIMERQGGELVLIDFAYAGRLGDAVPDDVPKRMYRSRTYGVEVDLERLDGRFI